MTALLLATAASLSPDDAFRRGADLRHDAAAARPHFAAAAAGFPPGSLNRARAAFLAGNLPLAVRAYLDALAAAPWDAVAQRELALCRAAVAYPTEAVADERTRPDPPTEWRNRVSPSDLALASAFASGLLAAALAARFTTRPGWGPPVALLGSCGLLGVIMVAWQIDREKAQDAAEPVVVLSAPAVLRAGNADEYPSRIAAPLPAGAEVRRVGRRGGWVRVRAAGGATGWLPTAVLLEPGS